VDGRSWLEKGGRMSAETKPAAHTAALPEESEQWKQAYRDPQLIARRRKNHARKLERLGVMEWNHAAPTLDLCCGTGEVLRILRDAGFTYLQGADVTVDEDLQKEPGIKTVATDCRKLPYADGTFEQLLCLHSLHHLGGVEGIAAALNESWRVLKPGGRIAIVDHFDSPQLRLAFWASRQYWLAWPTSGLRSFHYQHIEEWPYLSAYLHAWPEIRKVVNDTARYDVQRDKQNLFFFYWVGKKK